MVTSWVEHTYVQNDKVKSVGVDSLVAGQIVEGRHLAPNSGHVRITLRAANGDYSISADSLIHHGAWIKRFIINSFVGRCWQKRTSKASHSLISRSASLDVISASHFSSSHNTMHGVLYNTPMKACPDEWDLPP